MKKLVMVSLASLVVQACAKPPEANLLPAPINEVRFGSSAEALKKLRPAVKTKDCGAPRLGDSKYTCLVELNPLPGFENAVYTFRHDKLESVSLSIPMLAWAETSFARLAELVPGRSALGESKGRIEVTNSSLAFSERWEHLGYAVVLRASLWDGTLLSKGTSSTGAIVTGGLSVWGPGVQPDALPPMRDAEVVEAKAIPLDQIAGVFDAFAGAVSQRARLIALIRGQDRVADACDEIAETNAMARWQCVAFAAAADTGRLPADDAYNFKQLSTSDQRFGPHYRRVLEAQAGPAKASAAREALVDLLRQ